MTFHFWLWPASLSVASLFRLICWRRTCQKIFPGTDNRLMPRQLLHCLRSHFLEGFMIIPFFHISGTFFSFQTWLKSLTSNAALRVGWALSMSAVILSSRGPLFPLVCSMAVAISASVMRPFFISISWCGPSMSISISPLGSSLFRISLKCSAHLFS